MKDSAYYINEIAKDNVLLELLQINGFTKTNLGYYYIGTAVLKMAEDMSYAVGSIGDLRELIASCYNTKASRVERAIRHVTRNSKIWFDAKQKHVINCLATEYIGNKNLEYKQ